MTRQDWPQRGWTFGQALDLHVRLSARVRTTTPPASTVGEVLHSVIQRHGPLAVGDVERAAVCIACTNGYEEHDPYPCEETRLIADGLGVPPDLT